MWELGCIAQIHYVLLRGVLAESAGARGWSAGPVGVCVMERSLRSRTLSKSSRRSFDSLRFATVALDDEAFVGGLDSDSRYLDGVDGGVCAGGGVGRE